jgi:uncharacterized protein YjhX (UPF0386 family)
MSRLGRVLDFFRSVGVGPWRARRSAAEERGIQLLKRNLSPTQLKQYESHKYFDVIGGTTGQPYRIRHGCLRNVDLVDKDGRPSRTLCFTPEGHLTTGDVMLAQKLALELFESEALMVANGTPVRDSISKAVRRDYRL